MLPDRVSNPGPLTYESGALPIALCCPAKISVCPKRFVQAISYFEFKDFGQTVNIQMKGLIKDLLISIYTFSKFNCSPTCIEQAPKG